MNRFVFGAPPAEYFRGRRFGYEKSFKQKAAVHISTILGDLFDIFFQNGYNSTG